jgi:predicted negative regulator of RcsB-dependent stress response
MAGPYDLEEQERIAELKAWWEDNRWFVAGAFVVAILSFAGWQGWQHWKQSTAEDAGAMFDPVSKAAKAKDAKGLEASAKALMDKHPRSFHASEAALYAAKSAFDAGKTAEAREKLEWGREERRARPAGRGAAAAGGGAAGREEVPRGAHRALTPTRTRRSPRSPPTCGAT